jgi:tRNA (cytidine/uridine-2'-O-)-methyltransferase
MDYLDHVNLVRHSSWVDFRRAQRAEGSRLILLTTAASVPHTRFDFRPDDVLLLGRESAGVPEEVHAGADAGVRVPIDPALRSLNVALAAAIVLGEALRQTNGYPGEED